MSNVNDRSFSSAGMSEGASHLQEYPRPHVPKPIWRARTTLGPVKAVKTLSTQIASRIVVAFRGTPVPQSAEMEGSERSIAAKKFAVLVLGDEDSAAFGHVEMLLSQGISVESIFLDLLAPTARQLGEQWETDVTDFATVTLGVSRLQRIMRRLGDSFFDERRSYPSETMLLTIIPGEQHSFGLEMVAEFFRRAGWNLTTGPFASRLELKSAVHDHWFDVIGFSVSSDRRLDELKQHIQDIRRDSRNQRVGVILGGPFLVKHPDLVAAMGADMMSVDAATAPQQARGLVARMQNQN